MTQDQWAAMDDYFAGKLMPADEALDAALRDSEGADLPQIQVTPNQGKLLYVLAKAMGARSILEIGTLGGYSTIWLARALPPDGKLITLEVDAKHAEVARANITRAGYMDRVEIRLGRALDTLAQLEAEKHAPFDLFFIDADKPNLTPYMKYAIKLARPGSLIIADNVVRQGGVLDANSHDENVRGVQRFIDYAASEPRLSMTAIQNVGSKGWDGIAFAVVV